MSFLKDKRIFVMDELPVSNTWNFLIQEYGGICDVASTAEHAEQLLWDHLYDGAIYRLNPREPKGEELYRSAISIPLIVTVLKRDMAEKTVEAIQEETGAVAVLVLPARPETIISTLSIFAQTTEKKS